MSVCLCLCRWVSVQEPDAEASQTRGKGRGGFKWIDPSGKLHTRTDNNTPTWLAPGCVAEACSLGEICANRNVAL